MADHVVHRETKITIDEEGMRKLKNLVNVLVQIKDDYKTFIDMDTKFCDVPCQFNIHHKRVMEEKYGQMANKIVANYDVLLEIANGFDSAK